MSRNDSVKWRANGAGYYHQRPQMSGFDIGVSCLKTRGLLCVEYPVSAAATRQPGKMDMRGSGEKGGGLKPILVSDSM